MDSLCSLSDCDIVLYLGTQTDQAFYGLWTYIIIAGYSRLLHMYMQVVKDMKINSFGIWDWISGNGINTKL